MALGLGDVELKSHLGEKLLAKVIVTDIDSQTDSNCFSASDNSDNPAFKKTNITLQSTNNVHQLIIATNEVMTEPIINLRLAFQCNPNINREYVLLLDPMPFKIIEKTSVNDDADAKLDNVSAVAKDVRQSPNKKPSPLVSQHRNTSRNADEIVPQKLTIKKNTHKHKTNAATSIDEKLNSAYTGKNTGLAKLDSNSSQASKSKSSDKPFLVISGGSANSAGDKTGISLRLATEIDFARPSPVATSPSAIDTLDEVTVMTNRLTHLEKQITSLQKRNLQLQAEAAKAKEENAATDWQQILLIALAAIATLAGIEWVRRKILARRENSETVEWFDTQQEIDAVQETSKISSLPLEKKDADDNFDDQLEQNFISNTTKLLTSFEILDHVSVLDEANVFIGHGRPQLAIQLLQNHLSEAPAESPEIWLKLLNLLAKENSQENYDDTVIECNKYFNIKAPKFGDTSEQDVASIEDYPHIITRLEGVWGSQYAVGVLNDIIYNKRSQPREGLEQGAFDDLFFLKMIAKYLDTLNPAPQQSANQASMTVDTEHDAIKVSSNDNMSLDYIETTPVSEQNAIEFNATETSSAQDNLLETIDFNIPDYDNPLPAIEESFEAEEITFAAIDSEIDMAAFEVEEKTLTTAPQEALKSKKKAETKASNSSKKQKQTNDIEWDLSGIKPKSDE